MPSHKQKKFSPIDRDTLERTSGVGWVPREPSDLLLPYMEKEGEEETTGVETRREKAKEIVAKYEEIQEKCKRIEDEISNRCKDVKVVLDKKDNLRAIEACERLFGRQGIKEITFEMYKAAVQAMTARANTATPEIPGDSNG
jgi:hypothetical protein